MTTRNDVIRRYFDILTGKTTRRNYARTGNVFADGDVLYSYGYHFELAVALRDNKGKVVGILLNGDKYSVCTSRHQSDTESWAMRSGLPFATIPFSALASAGVENLAGVEILDTRPARVERIVVPVKLPENWHEHGWREKPQDSFTGPSWQESRNFFRDKNGRTMTYRDRHFLGGSLIRATSSRLVRDGGMTDDHRPVRTTKVVSRTVTMLSDWDRNEPSGRGYFLCEIPGKVSTIEEAYEALKPQVVKDAEASGIEVKRQGDIFAIPLDEVTLREYRKRGWNLDKGAQLLTTNHVATDVLTPPGKKVNHHLARGTLRHVPQGRRPDHVRVSLGKTWHLIVKNTVPVEVVA